MEKNYISPTIKNIDKRKTRVYCLAALSCQYGIVGAIAENNLVISSAHLASFAVPEYQYLLAFRQIVPP